MHELLRKYLLSTAVRFAPPDPPAGGTDGGEGDQGGDDDQIVVDLEDDEHPAGEGDDDQDSDDEQDDDEQDGDDPGGAQPPERQSRGDRQYGDLRKQARETARQNAELTRQLAELRGEMSALRQPQNVGETAAQRAERLALLSPEERIQETVNETLRIHEQRSMQLQNQLLDQADQSTFAAQAAANPLLKKLAPEVERRLADLRSKGQNLPRNVVATYLIGEKVMAQQGQKKPTGQRRRDREQARPARPQGDVGGGRPRSRAPAGTVEDIESRYGDVPI